MPIETIPIINVDGIDLAVYSLDFEAGVNDKPSVINISFINEDGEYEEPELTVNEPTTITIGDDFIFNYYPVECNITQATNGGKILSIKYVDQSLILDKIYVGLKNKHGFTTEMPILIVGEEVDPCEEILTGIYSGAVTVDDPCNPCTTDGSEGGNLQERLIQCQEDRVFKVLEVEYTLNDLLDEIQASTTIELAEERPFSNDEYTAKYTGTLRNVLQNWGSDYGFTFFWDEDDVLQFQDLRGGIAINDEDIVTDDNIISTTTNKTLEGTVGKGIIGHFSKDGELREYDCENDWCKKINMRPITLDNIIVLGDNAGYKNLDALQFIIAMSVYSPIIRDNYIWFIQRGLKDMQSAKNAVKGARQSHNNDGNGENFEGYNISTLGMSIKHVFDPEDDDDAVIHTKLLEEIFNKDPEKLKEFGDRGGYFLIAKYNKDKHTRLYEFEASLGSDFMGKYFYRRFTENFKGTSYSYLSPDGDSIRYYRRADPLQLPFIELIKDNLKQTTTWLKSLVAEGGEEAGDHFLLLERNNLWWPLEKNTEEMNEAIDIATKEHWDELGQVGLEIDKDFADGLKIKEEEGDQYMIAYENKSKFKVHDRGEKTHPIEKENVSLDVDVCNLGTKYGLREATCHVYGLEIGGTKIQIATPTQGHLKNDTDSDTEGVQAGPAESPYGTHAGYDIIWEKHGNARTLIPQNKIEIVRGKGIPQLEDNVMATDINNRDLTQDVYDIFDSDVENLCNPKSEDIGTRMDSIMEGLDFSIDEPFTKRGYVLAGIPHRRYTIADGLESMSLRMGTDGLESHMSFGNTKKVPISSNFFVQQYEAWHKKNRGKSPSVQQLPQPEEITTI